MRPFALGCFLGAFAVLIAAPVRAQDGAPGISECDRLAASGDDPSRPPRVAGVLFSTIDAKKALPACLAAAKAAPQDARTLLQLGRALRAAQKYEQARKAYRLAASLGSVAAQVDLGFLHATGAGGARDLSEARKLYEKAASAGSPSAMALLAAMTEGERGRSVAQSSRLYDAAIAAFERRKDVGGRAEALYRIAIMYEYGEPETDLPRAREWHEQAAAAGFPEAMTRLGLFNERGSGGPTDVAKARRWYEWAANAGSLDAFNNLGALYERADAAFRNPGEAQRLYGLAARFGHTAAAQNLKRLGVSPVEAAPDDAWLGVSLVAPNPETAEALGVRIRGAILVAVDEGGPGEAGGLRAADIVLKFDGKEIWWARNLALIVAQTPAGKEVEIVVSRDGKEQTLRVKLGRVADRKTAARSPLLLDRDLGLTLGELDDAARARYGVDKNVAGVLVADVRPGSPVAEKNMSAGDVVLQIYQKNASSPAQAQAEVDDGRKAGTASVFFLVARGQSRRFVVVPAP